MKKQKGAAAVMFLCMLPLMIGFLVFTNQATQMLQSDAKLMEATEVATLAVIANSAGNTTPDDKLAQMIVNRYVPDNKDDVAIMISSNKCEYGSGCMGDETSPYSDFTVIASTKHKSWAMFNDVPYLKKEFTVSSKSHARKYLPKPVDIYFVVDMSESMGRPFRSDKSRKKIDVVKTTIKNITDELEKMNKASSVKSRVSFIGYNHLNVQLVNGVKYFTDQVVNNSSVETVNQMFDEDKELKLINNGSNNEFYDIDLTSDYDTFNKIIKTFEAKAYGSTASWQGVIRAAQVTNHQSTYNSEQIIIVLSDGSDAATHSLPKNFLQYLVRRGLCKKIVENLKEKTDSNGNNLNVKFNVIGVDFYLDSSANGFYDCVGKDNIYEAKQGDDVYKYVINLLNEETGRLKL